MIFSRLFCAFLEDFVFCVHVWKIHNSTILLHQSKFCDQRPLIATQSTDKSTLMQDSLFFAQIKQKTKQTRHVFLHSVIIIAMDFRWI